MNDSEILFTSQTDAKRILDESAERATAVLSTADKRASELLMKQRDRAARLLFEQHNLALAAHESAVGETDVMSDANAANYVARNEEAAEELRREEQRVAAELAEAEAELAKSAADKITGQACTILMAAQREAAVILLTARMRVEDNRVGR